MGELADQIKESRQAMMAQTSAEVLALLQDSTKDLVDSGIAERSLAAGQKAPDFTLPDIDGGSVTLSEQLARGSVVLSFYRGGLQYALAAIEATGASLLAIAPELPEKGAATSERAALSFPLLTDLGNSAAAQFGLVFTLAEDLRPVYESFGLDIPATNGDDSFELPMPATYIINRDGLIAHAFVNADYTQRLEPAEIISILKQL